VGEDPLPGAMVSQVLDGKTIGLLLWTRDELGKTSRSEQASKTIIKSNVDFEYIHTPWHLDVEQ
jgi:hypothetical protein